MKRAARQGGASQLVRRPNAVGHSISASSRIKVLRFGGAFPLVFAVFIFCQTSLLDTLIGKSGAALLLTATLAISLTGILLAHGVRVINGGNLPVLLCIAASCTAGALIFYDFDFAISSIAKLIYLSVVAQLCLHPRFGNALIASADLGFALVVCIFTLSIAGVIPTFSIETAETVKFSGGFNNPNVGPFFLYSSFLVFVAFGMWRRALLAVLVLLFCYFQLDISSTTRTFAAAMVLLGWLIMTILPARLFSVVHSLALTTLMVVGSIIYLSPFIAPVMLDDYVGGVLDFALSQRIWILANDFTTHSNTLVGFTLNPLDSTYSELIYIAGPFFFLITVYRLIRIFFHSGSSTLLSLQLFLLGFLVAGLVESSLFTLTPLSLFFMVFIFKGTRACLSIRAYGNALGTVVPTALKREALGPAT